MRTSTKRRIGTLAALTALAVAAAGPALADVETTFELRPAPIVEALPPLPPPSVFPVQLVLDDDAHEGSFGVAGAGGARQFLWFDRFASPAQPFTLEEVWVLFPRDINVPVGGAVQIVVYQDPDGDPTNGADLVTTFDATVQAADDLTFSVYPLPDPMLLAAGPDVLIGVVPRFVESGVTPPTSPAALDTTTPQGRSWFAVWSGDPPDPPLLPADALTTPVDPFGAGNWMIRGFGSGPPVVVIPTLGPVGLAWLGILLVVAALPLLARRRRTIEAGVDVRAEAAPTRRSRSAARKVLSLAVVGLGVALAMAIPVQGQTVIDYFSTEQSAVTDPPGGPPDSASTIDGATILGGERDLAVERLSGAGTVTGEVSIPRLLFSTALATTGEARVVWDGNDDDATALDPTGLGGVDLTSGGGSSMCVQGSNLNGEVSAAIEVFTDGANASRAVMAIPVGPEDGYCVSLADFSVQLGAGADFTDVGAIVLTLSCGADCALEIYQFEVKAPLLAATKVDALQADADMDGQVDPGDTVRYTITLTNTGGEAMAVALSDMIDSNTTLVGGSVRSTPVAKDDQYEAVGNVTLVADGTPWPGLLANDTDPDGDAVTVTAFDATTLRGGTVSMVDVNTGTFDYVSPAGFRGVDAFGYTIEDDDGNAVSATATVDVAGIVWFVDNTNTGCGSPPCGIGTQADPFQTLAQVQAAAAENDVLRLRRGDGTSTGYDVGIALANGQELIGGGVPLVIGGEQIEPADAGPPLLENAAGNGIDLALDNTIRGLTIGATAGMGLKNGGMASVGNLTVSDVAIQGAGGILNFDAGGTLDVTLSSVSTTSSATRGINLDGGVTGSLTVAGATTLDGTTAHAIYVHNANGAFDFGAASLGQTTPVGQGVDLDTNGASTITFDALAVTTSAGAGLRANASGTLQVAGVGNTVSAAGGAALDLVSTSLGAGATFASLAATGAPIGVRLDGVTGGVTVTGATTLGTTGTGLQSASSGAFTTGTLSVTTSAGTGLLATNTGALTVATATGSQILATGGPGVNITGTPLSVQLATLSSTNSSARGLTFSGASGTLVAGAGSVSGVPNGNRGISINGGSLALTYGGTVTYTANDYAVRVQDTSSGSATFNGKVSSAAGSLGLYFSNVDSNATFADLDLGTSGSPLTSKAITLANGSTGTFTFSDTQIFTSGATGIDANNGGTVQVTGAGNRVSATNGVAISMIGGTTIGASGVTFDSVSANGAASGIVLSNAGTGGFNVVGNGATGSGTTANNDSGGSILNTTDDGVQLTSVSNVSLAYMRIQDAGNHGIDASGVTNFTLSRSNLVSNGNANLEHGLYMLNPAGTVSVAHVLADGNYDAHLRVFSQTGNDLTLFQVMDSTLQNVTSGFYEDGISFEAQTGVTTAISVTNSTFANHDGDHIQVSTNGATDATVTISGNTMTGTASNLGAGITVNSADTYSGTTNFLISGNNLQKANDNSSSINVNIGLSNASGSYVGTISDNVIGTMGTADSAGDTGIMVQVNRDATMTVAITRNTIREFDNNGITLSSVDGVGTLNATVTGNTVTSADSNAFAAVFADGQSSNILCADIGDDTGSTPALENTMSASAGFTDVAFQTGGTGTINLEGYGGAADNQPAIQTYIQGRNAGTPGVQLNPGGSAIQGGGACPTP